MKILQVNSVYGFGSTGKITADIHRELLHRGIESIVCYGRRDNTSDVGVYRICSDFYSHVQKFSARATGFMNGGCWLSTHRLIKIIEKEKPNVVHLQCINEAFVNIYELVAWLKKHHYKTVLTLHAEFMYTGGCSHAFDCDQWSTHEGCGHSKCPRYRSDMHSWFFDRTSTMWKRMKQAFEGFENLTVVSVSPWLKKRAERAPIFTGMKHCVVYNGLNTDVFHLYKESKLRNDLDLLNKPVIFHVTPAFSMDQNHIKGGYYVFEVAKCMPNAHFVIAGSYPGNLEVPGNVHMLGEVNNQQLLAQYYSMANITLLTSKKETFSMVCAESLCCGTPVVGFKAGAPELISLGNYSKFVEHGNVKFLVGAIDNMLLSNHSKEQISYDAAKYYSTKGMVDRYEEIYRG